MTRITGVSTCAATRTVGVISSYAAGMRAKSHFGNAISAVRGRGCSKERIEKDEEKQIRGGRERSGRNKRSRRLLGVKGGCLPFACQVSSLSLMSIYSRVPYFKGYLRIKGFTKLGCTRKTAKNKAGDVGVESLQESPKESWSRPFY